MNILFQMFYAVKRMIMNPKAILINLLTYAIIILILGSVFGSTYDIQKSLGKVTIAYANLDSGRYGAIFDAVLHSNDVTQLAELKPVTSLDDGKVLMNKDEADAIIYIPDNFSDDGDLPHVVNVYLSTDYGVPTMVVKNIVSSLTNLMNTSSVIYNITGQTEVDAMGSEPQKNNEENVKEQSLTSSSLQATTAMGYYSIAMILMLLLYGQEYGIFMASEDYLGTLGNRMRLSAVKPYVQYIGKALGLSLVTFFQGVILLLFTKYVYGVDWGNHIIVVLLTLFILSILVTLLGLMLVIITRDIQKAQSLSNFITLGGTFIVGGFVIVDFGSVAYLSPSYYAKTALFNVVYGNQVEQALINIGLMILICVVFVLVSLAASRRTVE
ncbi:ABC transporter permease [Paenibacillus apiarius]|uniref:ABC transporter permease n=1 Tax=Paenibacillus apiarius TaxID=46240 RepID=A0ABT4DXR8_9BACL|nr:ABC transporter permease [Paenibacillus apiarius]MCY9517598.1 ABC transporter permease [Paenibacillus apiarius]MCY9522142.1 ABC transporter permease [Paenibacillus apiarius]MCY9559218.1 ABC transporter permease [Paenibacillus apiarius]MCY9683641.1 ABC transporter permease [Paenibacillus apiarius]MCY9726426.1 ABC transporter permease [Paenibacillus apiarius]